MIHTIHVRPEAFGEQRWAATKAVPETNAKWALIVPPLWLARHRLVFELAVYAMIGIAVLILLFTPFALAALAVAGFPSLYLYLEGNQLRRNALKRRGYRMVDLVEAPDEEMALAKFFDGEEAQLNALTLPSAERRRVIPPVRDEDLSFGLFGGSGT